MSSAAVPNPSFFSMAYLWNSTVRGEMWRMPRFLWAAFLLEDFPLPRCQFVTVVVNRFRVFDDRPLHG